MWRKVEEGGTKMRKKEKECGKRWRNVKNRGGTRRKENEEEDEEG